MLGATVTFIFLYNYSSSFALYLWFGLVTVVSLWRIHIVKDYYQTDPPPEDRYSWFVRYTLWSTLSGIVWGILAFHPTAGLPLIIMDAPLIIIAIVAVVVLPVYSFFMLTYVSFLCVLLIVALIGFEYTERQNIMYIASLYLVLTVLFLSTARKFCNNQINMLTIDNERKQLFEQMQEQNRELETLNNNLSSKQSIIDQEMVLAKNVFSNLTSINEKKIEAISIWNKPMRNFSGDLIQVISGSGNEYYIMHCDFTGHGMPAALGAIPCSSIFQAMAEKSMPLETIVTELNSKLFNLLPTGYFCCAVLVRIFLEENRMTCWNGGLPEVIVVNEAGNITTKFKSTSFPLAIKEDMEQPIIEEVTLNSNDCVYVYSDGLIEAYNPANEMWGQQNLETVISIPLKKKNRLKNLQEILRNYMGEADMHDDISIIEYNHIKAG